MPSTRPTWWCWCAAASALLAACGERGSSLTEPTCPAARASADVTHFHGDARRLGWRGREPDLQPAALREGQFGALWRSPPFDAATLDGRSYEAHAYASPLYVDAVQRADGGRGALVFTATSNGWVYAISASQPGCRGNTHAPGEIVWRTQLGTPAPIASLDGGMPMGVLGTPVIDLEAVPPRLYVAAMDAGAGWRAFALELGSGRVLDGWPVTIEDAALGAVNSNGPARFQRADAMSQRTALALSPDGALLYLGFGTYRGQGVGWLVAIDTSRPAIAHAFSSAPYSEEHSNGGIWGPAGPTVAGDGSVFLTTGNSPPDTQGAPRTFGNSLLRLDRALALQARYTPFNYCALDTGNIEIGASQPLLLPELDPARSATPNLIAFGGKQGSVYLLDRDRLGEAGDRRTACTDDSSADASLLPPEDQPQFGRRGPLNVFGPYSERFGEVDYARMRSKLAYFPAPGGEVWLYATGATKRAEDSIENVAPSLARLRLALTPGEPAHLALDRTNRSTAPALRGGASFPDVAFMNPGSPVVTSDGSENPIVWVLDANALRSASLLGPEAPRPVLYAFDGTTLQRLWQSDASALGTGGKYAVPAIAHGQVFVATDRLYAFGVR